MSRITYIPNRIIDSDGIADGAEVFVYQSGTTTPVELFLDAEFSTPTTNPYVVAAGAEFPPLYHNFPGEIRLRIISLSGNIQDEDPYDPLAVGFPYITPQQFGAVADNVTDDSQAFVDAIAYLKTQAETGTYGSGSAKLFIPAGKYYLGTTTLDISHTLRIEGEGTGEAGGAGSFLRWAANTTGIRIQRFDTDGASGDTGNGIGGDASIISGLYLKGAYTNIASEGDYHGIHLRARAFIRDCYIENFQGDGIFANCSAGSGGATEGNANNIRAENVFITLCRNGIWLQGSDVNAGSFIAIDALGNRRWGIHDESFLGNSFYSCHTGSNGVYADITPTMVHNNGHYYTPIMGTSGHSTNSPPSTAVDDARWYYVRDGAVDATRSILQWTNGMAVRDGGPYMGGLFNNVLFSDCYAENDQSLSQLGTQALWLNGNQNSGVKGPRIYAVTGQVGINYLVVPSVLEAGNSNLVSRCGNFFIDSGGSSFFLYGKVSGADYWQVFSGGGYVTYYASNNASNGHRFQNQANGDLATINGSGITVLFGGLGYGTGVGGAQTQATSRTTGVTLDKICGAITLVSAAGSATYQSFTVTNNKVAATDTIIVNQKSGTDLYEIHVTNIAAGSFRITYRTTGGTTTEQPVFNFSVIKAVAA